MTASVARPRAGGHATGSLQPEPRCAASPGRRRRGRPLAARPVAARAARLPRAGRPVGPGRTPTRDTEAVAAGRRRTVSHGDGNWPDSAWQLRRQAHRLEPGPPDHRDRRPTVTVTVPSPSPTAPWLALTRPGLRLRVRLADSDRLSRRTASESWPDQVQVRAEKRHGGMIRVT